MVAVVKMKSNSVGNQNSPIKKTPCQQNKEDKPQTKRKKEAKSEQIVKHVKNTSGMVNLFLPKRYHLTAKAQGVLSSSVKNLCKMVSSKAEDLRKERNQSTVGRKILGTALKHCFDKRNISHGLVRSAKKANRKTQTSVDVARKAARPPELQTAPGQAVPKQPCKALAIPVCNECA